MPARVGRAEVASGPDTAAEGGNLGTFFLMPFMAGCRSAPLAAKCMNFCHVARERDRRQILQLDLVVAIDYC